MLDILKTENRLMYLTAIFVGLISMMMLIGVNINFDGIQPVMKWLSTTLNNTEALVAFVASFATVVALIHQIKETRKNGEINSYTYIASVLQEKIDFHDAIIKEKKSMRLPWKGHADRVNIVLRPMKESVDKKLVEHMCSYKNMPDKVDILKAIQSKKSVPPNVSHK